MPTSHTTNETITLRLGDKRFVAARFSPFSGEEPLVKSFRHDGHSSLATSLRACWASLPLLSADYRRQVVLVGAPYTLVPLGDFHEEQVEAIFRLNFPRSQDQVALFSILPRVGAAAIWGIDRQAKEFLLERWPSLHFSLTSAWLIQHFWERSRTSRCTKLFAYRHENTLELVAIAADRLLLANSYCAETLSDAAYYVLLAYKQLELQAAYDEIYIVSDDRAAGAELLTHVSDFVENVYPINPTGEYNRHPLTQMAELPYDQLLFLLRNY